MKRLFKSQRLIVGLLVVAALAFGAAYVLKTKTEAGIQAAITAQIEAFRRDDGEAAFAIAAPEIQAKFGSARSFMNMVAATYPQVYRPRRVDFLDIMEADGKVLQKVLLIDHEGNDALAVYSLVLIEGIWRISGCMVSRPPGQMI
jgi:hypothetical protein